MFDDEKLSREDPILIGHRAFVACATWKRQQAVEEKKGNFGGRSIMDFDQRAVIASSKKREPRAAGDLNNSHTCWRGEEPSFHSRESGLE